MFNNRSAMFVDVGNGATEKKEGNTMGIMRLRSALVNVFGIKKAHSTRGASMVEYAILIAFIAILVIVSAQGLRQAISGRFTAAATSLNNAN